MRAFVFATAWTMALLASACSGGDDSDGGLIHLDGASAPDTVTPAGGFTVHTISECGEAGYQTVAASSGNKLAFATLASTTGSASCALEERTATAPVYNVCVVTPSASGFAGNIVVSQPYIAQMGVGIAFDKAGDAVLAYTGGPSGAFRCGASDMMIAKVNGAQLAGARTVAADSRSAAVVPEQAVNCAAQDVCHEGDSTGYWPSIALDPVAGTVAVAFRDMHFGFADTDFASSDVEFARGDAYSITTVDVARGGGTYNRLAFTPAGKAAIVHYSLDFHPAIWLDRETAQGWESKKLFTGEIREQLGFAISSNGLHAVAYFDSGKRLLMYIESADGASWSAPENVDRDGLTGYFPSLAFDGDGNPGVAYYRCNDYGASSCDGAKDGLYLARRRGSSWTAEKVVADPSVLDGSYTALAFVGGKAVIAYQTSYYDAGAKTSKVVLQIAKEM